MEGGDAGGESGYKNVEIEKNTKVFDVIINIIKLELIYH